MTGRSEADGRDDAAAARDHAAEERDVVDASATDAAREDADRDFAAEDRAAAALDRADAARRAAAALARDEAAQARDRVAARVDRDRHARDDHGASAADRVAAAHDRDGAAADREQAASLLRASYRDELTGALLRDPGTEQLGAAVDRARREGGALTLLFADVDHLKSINDDGGHAAGDRVLAAVGEALRRGLRSYDTIVRFGGDEFVCALPGTTQAGAEGRVDQLRAILRDSGTGASITVGYAELRADDSLEALVARADADLYARRSSRD